MNSPRDVQQSRFIEKFERELGGKAREGIADSAVTDLIVNQDGHLWLEAHGKGMWDSGCVMRNSGRKPHRHCGGFAQYRRQRADPNH